jgi:hypothetical protein
MNMIMYINPEDMVRKTLQKVASSRSVKLRAASTGKDASQHDMLHAMK